MVGKQSQQQEGAAGAERISRIPCLRPESEMSARASAPESAAARCRGRREIPTPAGAHVEPDVGVTIALRQVTDGVWHTGLQESRLDVRGAQSRVCLEDERSAAGGEGAGHGGA